MPNNKAFNMLCLSECPVGSMAFTLHQSGHGHSHGGLSSGHGHSHGTNDKSNHGHSHAAGNGHGHSHKRNHSHSNGNQENHSHGNGDVEQHNGVDCQQQKSAGSRPQANASVRAAFVHVVGDLLQSISVLVSAIIIFFKVSGQRSTGVTWEMVINWGDGGGSGQLGSCGR